MLRATGRMDVFQLRLEQVPKALTHDAMEPYLVRYLRPERVRLMLVRP